MDNFAQNDINKCSLMTKTYNDMRHLFFFVSLLIATITANDAQAQTFAERMHFETSVGAGIKEKGTTPIDFSFKFHVDVLRMSYVFITAEDNISLHKDNGVKTYYKGASLGGGLGVKLLNNAKSVHALDVRLKVLGALGGADWKHTTYDASLAWYMKAHRFSPVVELGYRHIDSRTNGIGNYGSAYLSIGLRY